MRDDRLQSRCAAKLVERALFIAACSRHLSGDSVASYPEYSQFLEIVRPRESGLRKLRSSEAGEDVPASPTRKGPGSP